MKKFGFFVLWGGILLIIWVLHMIISSNVPSRLYRKSFPLNTDVYIFTDTTKILLSEFRTTNYVIKPKPIYSYDEDGELEVEYEEYDRSYYGGGFKGGSYSGGK